MKRLALPTALLTTLAMPAGALAAGSGRGVVLSLDAAHHTVQLVAADHSVHAYRYRGRLGHVSTGSTLRFSRRGNRISAVRVTGRSRQVSYLAKVVRSSRKHLVLRVADGRTVSLPGRRIRNAQAGHVLAHQVLAHAAAIAWTGSAPAATIQIQGLASGTTVLVNESLTGNRPGTITLTIPPAVPASGGSGGSGGATSDQTGSITQLSAGSVTIQTQGAGPMTFSVAPGSQLTRGFAPGDVVDVTYRAGSNGAGMATDLEYVESDATGTVTSASDASLAITDAGTGQTDSLTAARSQLMFTGVLVGDQVNVSYHLTGTRMVADGVDDITANANR